MGFKIQHGNIAKTLLNDKRTFQNCTYDRILYLEIEPNQHQEMETEAGGSGACLYVYLLSLEFQGSLVYRASSFLGQPRLHRKTLSWKTKKPKGEGACASPIPCVSVHLCFSPALTPSYMMTWDWRHLHSLRTPQSTAQYRLELSLFSRTYPSVILAYMWNEDCKTGTQCFLCYQNTVKDSNGLHEGSG